MYNVLKKGMIFPLILITVLMLCCTAVYAQVTDVVIKGAKFNTQNDFSGNYFQYTYNQLTASYMAGKLGGGDGGLLYSDYSNTLSLNGQKVIAFNDSSKGYIDYNDINSAYIAATLSGKPFDVNQYIASLPANKYPALTADIQSKVLFVRVVAGNIVREGVQIVKVETPVANPPSGAIISSGDSVTLTTNTTGAVIHYSLDGTNPTTSSPIYTSPITLTASTTTPITVKAIAVKSGCIDSELMTATYTVSVIPADTLTGYTLTPGTLPGTTKVTNLALPQGATKWKYKVQATELLPIPAKNSTLSGTSDLNNDIPVSAGQHLIILATDNLGKIIAYADVTVLAEHIRPSALISPNHYSVPAPGMVSGTTKISTLNLPVGIGAAKWQYLVQAGPLAPVPGLDTKLAGAQDCTVNTDITITAGEHLILMATDSSGSIKAFADLTVTAGQIKAQTAALLDPADYSTPEKGTAAGTTKISSLNKVLPVGEKWQIKVQDGPFSAPELNSIITPTIDAYTAGTDIQIKEGQTLVLVETASNGAIKAYAAMTVTATQIAEPAGSLVLGTNYSNPVQGNAEGTTKIDTLLNNNFLDVTGWKYIVQNTPINKPLKGSVLTGTNYTAGNDITIAAGQHLIILGVNGGGETIAYADIVVNASQIKPSDAPPLAKGTNYSEPEKGSAPGTTKIATLNPSGFAGVTKWMIKVYDGPNPHPKPALYGTVQNAVNYSQGANILISAGQRILILATDSNGNVLAYGDEEVTADKIAPPNAPTLKLTTNYSSPEPGTVDNTTQIKSLSSAGFTGVTKWYYKVQTGAIPVPGLGTILSGTTEYDNVGNPNISIVAGQHLILLATNDSQEIIAFADITVTAGQINPMDAPKLATPANYSTPVPGTAPGTTKIDTLNSIGVLGGTKWMYKVNNGATNPVPALDGIVSGTVNYTAGSNIQIKDGQYLLLLATDNGGKVKAYEDILVNQAKIKPENALTLGQPANYTTPVPGTAVNTTKIAVLSGVGFTGVSKWFYKIETGPVTPPALGTVHGGTTAYTAGSDITAAVGEHLLLIAADASDKTIAYADITLGESNIKAPSATSLALATNYTAPVVGSNSGSTKIDTLNLIGILGGSKWKIKVSNNAFSAPDYNSVATGAIDYTQGTDIKVVPSQHILLLATDNTGKIKAFADIAVAAAQVKSPNAGTLTVSSNYSSPEPGTADNTTKIASLTTTGLANASKWRVAVQAGAFTLPDYDVDSTTITGAVDYSGGDITVSAGQHLLLMETDSSDKIKACKDITIEASMIKIPAVKVEATLLDNRVTMSASGIPNTTVSALDNTWVLNVTTGTVKPTGLSNNDLEITSLPYGLTTSVVKGAGNTIVVTVAGTAAPEIVSSTAVKIKIKGSAVTELATISDEINVTIEPASFQVAATATDNIVTMIAPENTVISSTDNKWVLSVTNAVLKDTLTKDNLIVSGLVNTGFDVTAVKGAGNTIQITLTGSATVPVSVNKTINIIIKADAVTTTGAMDSVAIPVTIKPGSVLSLTGVGVNIAAGQITNTTTAMEYNLNSTDGSGAYTSCSAPNTDSLIFENHLQADKKVYVYVREKTQPGNMRLVKTLQRPAAPNVKADLSLGTTAVKLIGASTAMDYSLNGGTTWIPVSSTIAAGTEGINADGKDLRVRTKATSTDLPSEPTAQLNTIIDLTSVSIDVANGKLIDTTSAMQYSLTSTDGKNGTWIDCTAGPMDVNFTPVKVYIRDKNQPTHFRLVATLTNGTAPAVTANVPGGDQTKVKLVGANIDMEYSINGGVTWIQEDPLVTDDADEEILEGNAEIDCSTLPNNDLRVRVKATASALPSVMTAKLNGIDMSTVGVDVAAGKITFTTSGMEYSFDNILWTSCANNNTTVTFVAGDLRVREKGRTDNVKTITIGYNTTPLPSALSYNVALGTITLPSSAYQYRIAGGPWKDVDGTGKATGVSFVPGAIDIRIKNTVDKLASSMVNAATIPAVAAAPSFGFDDYQNIIIGLNADYEYKIGSGAWTSGSVAADFSGNKTVQVRKAATASELPSLIQTLNFTAAKDFSTVKVNVAAGTLTSTTSEMQYGINTDLGDAGKMPASWYPCTNSVTNGVSYVPGFVWIRETVNPSNKMMIQKIEDYGTKPNVSGISYDIAAGTITGTEDDMQFSIAGGQWINVMSGGTTSGIVFAPGTIQIRYKATETKLPSNPENLSTPVPTPAPAPTLSFDPANKTIPGLDSTYEYKIGSGLWVSGDVAGNFNVMETIWVRFKATATTLPSYSQGIYFAHNIDLSSVSIDIAQKAVKDGANAVTTGIMQYSLDSTNGVDGSWYDCQAGIDFDPGAVYVRETAYPLNYRKVADILPRTNINVSGISFDVASKIITGTADNMEFSIGGGPWTPVAPGGTTTGVVFNPGSVQVRVAATTSVLASNSGTIGTVILPAAPVLVYSDVANSITGIADNNAYGAPKYEYSLNSGANWTLGDVPGDFSGNKTVWVRTRATKTELASPVQIITFTAP